MQPYEVQFCFGRRTEEVQGTSGKPPASGITRQLCRRQFPVKRPDAPTTAREWNLPSHGALTLFFRWRKKSVQKKASGTALREKALYCPFLKEGVRNVARRLIGEITHTFVRARAHSFPLSKRARLFPSAAYRRSAPPQLALDRLKCR